MAQKVDARIAATDRKYPGRATANGIDLAEKLEFFDLRELQDLICAKPSWPSFEQTFGTKETLNARFAQLAELRNAIRHSRSVDPVAIKDAEAALLWFEQVFDAPEDDAELGSNPSLT